MPLYDRAPTRIDLAGGWTDLIPFARENEGGVVNAAIDLHVYVCLTPVPDSCVSLYAVDLKELFHPIGVLVSLHGLNLSQAVLSRFRHFIFPDFFRLTPLRQEVFRLYYLHELPIKTVAQQLGRSEDTIKAYLRNARLHLQDSHTLPEKSTHSVAHIERFNLRFPCYFR